MNHLNYRIPVAMEPLAAVLEGVCRNQEAYSRFILKPPGFIIPLDAGDGQTTILEYITDVFYGNHIRFFAGPDLYLEYRPDGTFPDMKRVFRSIHDCAVYTNYFEGVIGLDISALSKDMQDYFLMQVHNLCSSATMVYFIGSAPSRTVRSTVQLLKEKNRNLIEIEIRKYTTDDLAIIMERHLESCGIETETGDQFHKALQQIAETSACKNVRDTILNLDKAKLAADYSHIRPKITKDSLVRAYAVDLGGE